MNQKEQDASVGDYGFLMFLTLLNVMNFVDRQLLASFANWIVPDLGLTNTEFGLLTGLIFIFFYSVAGVFMGVLADRVNRTRLIAAGLALWSALTALSGMAKGFVSLAIPRLFIGIGESIMTPTAMSLLADRFPSSRLGFASGVYYMGVPIGVAASLFVVAYLEPLLGWRGCFYALGGLGLALAAIMFFMKETPRKHETEALAKKEAEKEDQSGEALTEIERPSVKEMLATLVQAFKSSPALLMTVLGGVAFHFVLGAATFEQLWFVQERGFDRSEIAELSGWLAFAGGIAGNLFGGIGGDWFLRKTGMGRPMFLFWIMLILTPISLYYRVIDPTSLFFLFGIFIGYFQLGCFYGPTFATVQELVPPQIRGTLVAFYILSLNFFGLGLGVTGGGIVVDWMIAEAISEPYTMTLLAFTALSLLAIPLFYFAGRRFERDREALYASMA
ncbi:MAG: MFS transporter [Pseudomonadota bacterium]|nr:MFS transporter [Pseudomonadota bacterium]|tara:strand:- start:4514 stop:5851 length:1338 start_codon:yes stop_codon:yes gene_type:complete